MDKVTPLVSTDRKRSLFFSDLKSSIFFYIRSETLTEFNAIGCNRSEGVSSLGRTSRNPGNLPYFIINFKNEWDHDLLNAYHDDLKKIL